MHKYFFGIVTLILISACKHELEQPTWTTQWVAPLAHSNLSIHIYYKIARYLGIH